LSGIRTHSNVQGRIHGQQLLARMGSGFRLSCMLTVHPLSHAAAAAAGE
jgi:hypothetical protein